MQVQLIHYGLHFYNSVLSLYNKINYYYSSIVKSISSDTIVFFNNNPVPYIQSYLNTTKCGPIVWKYSMYNKRFFIYNCSSHDLKRFPILSASLQSDTTIIYLDDFFNDLHIEASNNGYPTLQQVIEVYAYTYGTVLDRSMKWKFMYMDLNANDYEMDAFHDSWKF